MAKFRKTFRKFPQTHLEIYYSKRSGKPGKNSPYRWEVIKEKWPDFNIFIDDNFYIGFRKGQN